MPQEKKSRGLLSAPPLSPDGYGVDPKAEGNGILLSLREINKHDRGFAP